MENRIDEAFDDMLDSVDSINDNFVNDYFNTDLDFKLPSEEEIDEELSNFKDELETEVISNVDNDNELNIEETNNDDVENDSDSQEESNEIEDTLDEDFIDKSVEKNKIDDSFNAELEENNIDINLDSLESIDEEPVDLSKEEIIKLLDKTEDGEEFFSKLEGLND